MNRLHHALALPLLLLGCDSAAEPDPPRPAAVSVTLATAELTALGATVQLVAAVRDHNGQPMPSAAVTWTSGTPAVATVDGSGLVTAAANGVATITATAGTVSAMATVTVAQRISAVRVAPDTVTLSAIGDTVRLTGGVLDANGHPVVAGAAVSWTSGDSAVAVVDSTGVVTAAAEGATAIMATAEAVSGSAAVTVAQVVGSVAVTPAADTVALGDTLRLSAEAFDDNGHRVAGARFEWRSSDTAVARVDQAGLMRGSGEGTAAITATAGDASAEAEIAVVNPDRAVLIALYEATDGPRWTRRDNWLTDAPLGDWYGVSTNGQGRVTALDLFYLHANFFRFSNNLTGHLPPELDNLTALERLTLYGDLSGEIPPELGNLAALQVLDLAGNDLMGEIPPELGNLKALETLSLAGNHLSDEIPSDLGNLTGLRYLNLSGNYLTGPIPPELGNLTTLKTLRLSRTRLTGPIPPELGNLTALKTLDLGQHRIAGRVPPELGNLAGLEVLDLSGAIWGPTGTGDDIPRPIGLMSGGLPATLKNLHELNPDPALRG